MEQSGPSLSVLNGASVDEPSLARSSMVVVSSQDSSCVALVAWVLRVSLETFLFIPQRGRFKPTDGASARISPTRGRRGKGSSFEKPFSPHSNLSYFCL